MIARVFGRVDGVEVEFTHKEGDSWVLEFPKKLSSGNYIAEVYAEDEAGNVDYCCTVLFAIDPDGVCMHAEPVRFDLTLVEEEQVRLELMTAEVYLEALPRGKCRGDDYND